MIVGIISILFFIGCTTKTEKMPGNVIESSEKPVIEKTEFKGYFEITPDGMLYIQNLNDFDWTNIEVSFNSELYKCSSEHFFDKNSGEKITNKIISSNSIARIHISRCRSEVSGASAFDAKLTDIKIVTKEGTMLENIS
ncbi:MAG: hypothetical protein AB1467_06830 [Candidatus Diapherotrites archaeon]